MKILYLHQFFKTPDLAGGTRSYDLAQKFINNGHQVVVVSSSDSLKAETKGRWTTLHKEGIEFHLLNGVTHTSAMSYPKRIYVFLKFTIFTTFRLLKLKGDLVLATSTPLTIGIPAVIKKWIDKTPYVFEIRDVWPEAVIAIGAIRNPLLKKVLYWLESVIYKNAAALVPLSTDMKRSIDHRFDLDIPIEVVENLSALERFRNGYDPNRSLLKEKLGFKPEFSVLYAGAFGKVNGLSYAVHLASLLLPKEPNIVFVLIGNGAERQEILRLAEEKGVLGKNLFVLDAVSKNELPQLYYECDMGSSYVIPIPELWANSANKFFDTLAAGRPVLINHEGWQQQVLLKHNAGYIMPHNLSDLNEETITKFITYCRDTDLHRNQRQNAADLAHNYSLETAETKYESIFAKIHPSLV